MEFINLLNDPSLALISAKEVLTTGGVIIFPTDTVYGLCALPDNKAALEKIYSLKNRPKSMPIPLLISGIDQLLDITSARNEFFAPLADLFWPGSLTMVLPNPQSTMSLVSSKENTIAVRCPDNDFVRRVAKDLGPLAVTSANVHGDPTPESADEIKVMLPEADLIIDGGPLKNGLASTLVDLTNPAPVILREGPISSETILESLKKID
tara:strand:- start:5719 stop:6345 length:627 start_codon:yes stop_codon:yes gene_type:complete